MSKVLIKNPDGSTFYGCECIRDVWPLLNELARKRGIVKSNFDVYQGSYSQSVRASAKTHYYGGVLDIGVMSAETAQDDLLEEVGFASYRRGPRSYDGFDPHFHIVYRCCPHLHQQAANQVSSWRQLRDGLVRNWKDRDATRPAVDRGVQAAVQWMNQQLGKVKTPVAVARTGGIYAMGAGRPISYSATMRGSAGNWKIIQTILQAQKVNGRPIYPGPLDGVPGPMTKAAVKRYQQLAYKTTDPKIADGNMGRTTFNRLTSWAGWKPIA